MPVTHTNRKGDHYYLHQGRTKTGKPKYFFSRKGEGALVDEVPEGYEIYERPEGQVYLRKAQPRLITDDELRAVHEALRRYAPDQPCLVDVKGNEIIVHHSDPRDYVRVQEILGGFGGISATELAQQVGRYAPAFRFLLVNEKKRLFAAFRWYVRWSEGWMPMARLGPLEKLTAECFPHLGSDSYHEL
jgi:hypothetical protein